MTDLIHYYAIPSRGFVTHWMLEETGEPYENRVLNLDKNEHKTPEYLQINPMGRVPALVHQGMVITETAAIVAYLAETFSDGDLSVSGGTLARGEFLRWLFFGPVSVEPAIGWAALGKVETEVDYRPFASLADIAATIELAVKGREYLVADRFTAADLMLGATIFWGTQLMPLLPAGPETLRYWQNLSDRPAWQRVWAENQAQMS